MMAVLVDRRRTCAALLLLALVASALPAAAQGGAVAAWWREAYPHAQAFVDAVAWADVTPRAELAPVMIAATREFRLFVDTIPVESDEALAAWWDMVQAMQYTLEGFRQFMRDADSDYLTYHEAAMDHWALADNWLTEHDLRAVLFTFPYGFATLDGTSGPGGMSGAN